jgi:hypothetical protein
MAKMPGLQRCLRINDGNTIAMRATTQLDNSKDACTLMTAMTPLLQGQQRQLDDYASLTAAEMPL